MVFCYSQTSRAHTKPVTYISLINFHVHFIWAYYLLAAYFLTLPRLVLFFFFCIAGVFCEEAITCACMLSQAYGHLIRTAMAEVIPLMFNGRQAHGKQAYQHTLTHSHVHASTQSHTHTSTQAHNHTITQSHKHTSTQVHKHTLT